MTLIPEPYVQLIINGVDVSSDLDPHVLDLTFTDNLHGTADELTVKLRDDQGLWRGPWRPEQGDIVVAGGGYRGGLFMPFGSFEVDIPNASGSRGNDVLEFKATSAFQSKSLKTKRPEGNENKTLKQIVGKVACRNGYGVSGDIEDIKWKYKNQRRERDLAFIRRLAEDTNHFVSLKDGKLVFFKRDEIEKRSPVRVFELTDGTTITDWSAQDNAHKTYSKAKVAYLDPDKKKLIEAEKNDIGVKTGDTLKIDERVESKGHAKKLAKSRLAKANEDKRTASLTVVGDPLLVAGQVVALGGTFGQYAGRYLIHVATHQFARASYTTQLEIKGVK
jgi:phage protein D